MNKLLKFAFICLFAAGLPAGALFAHNGEDHGKTGTPSAGQVLATVSRADYPLETCVVSGDKLEGGDMGEPIDYIHKEKGKPDRLVRLCCKSCVRDFRKDPDKYLKQIDEAAAARAQSAGGHDAHHH
ncbi:hypothetical protein OpiT1DRAFT_01035 [Opitutaceae bacterium TAV1]|nr:hypothetical protein OpiT1DRAFT_01035 [Opitutaceae bacterium TAV1]